MFNDHKMDSEGMIKKENEGQASLQKLIKLDCRDSNFIFKDSTRNQYFRVHYPHTNTDVSSGEHLLKRFWLHIESHYFKKVDKEETVRLDYLKSIFSESITNASLQFQDQQFLSLLHEVFTDEVLMRMKNDSKQQMDMKNLVNRLYIIWKKSQIKIGIKQNKNIEKKLHESLNLLPYSKNRKQLLKFLQQEDKFLNQILSSDIINGTKKYSESQIEKQISNLENQLQQICHASTKTLTKIESYVQPKLNPFIKIEQNIQKQTHQRKKNSKQFHKYRKSQIQTVPEEIHNTIELDEIQFLIRNLEERQLAESISKILECRKINGEYFYLVSFEQALHLEPKLMGQKQVMRLNKFRQTSLFQFYRTGVKSLYSYTCQSYAGFGELSQNRHFLGKYKPKDIFEMMHRTPNLTPETLATFSKFYTCHHCKFLYPDYLLKTCKFSSDRQALPKNTFEATLDPDFSQILCPSSQTAQSKGRASQRFTTRKKNCLTGYAKINQEYVCGRKYCLLCLKDCYTNEVMNESIFCPFCQGNCQCSRCLRNEKIVKFKNAYNILGGDLLRLSVDSCIQKLQNKQESLQPKRRGRPKKMVKKLQHVTISKLNKKNKVTHNQQLKLQGLNTQRRITLATNKKEYTSFSIIKQSEQKKIDFETEMFNFIITETKKRKASKKQLQLYERINKTLEKLGRSKTN